MTVEERVNTYCDYNRISNERRALMLKTLRTFEANYCPLPVIDAGRFQLFMGDLMMAGNNVNTIRKLGNMVRVFVRQMWKDGEISADTYLRVKAVPNPRGASGQTKPRPYTQTEIALLYAEIEAKWPRPAQITLSRFQQGIGSYPRVYPHLANKQTKAIVALALHCGMRRNEIYGATINDIHPDNEYVVVRQGKSKITGEPRYREVPWTEFAREAVMDWLIVRDWLHPTHDSPWLVLTTRATQNSIMPSSPVNPMSKDAFEKLMRRLGSGWGLHRLRHTCATFKLRAGMPIEVLSKFLGHSTIQQTLCYVELDRTDVQRHSRMTEGTFLSMVGRR